jgi:hypothetical protein
MKVIEDLNLIYGQITWNMKVNLPSDEGYVEIMYKVSGQCMKDKEI